MKWMKITAHGKSWLLRSIGTPLNFLNCDNFILNGCLEMANSSFSPWGVIASQGICTIHCLKIISINLPGVYLHCSISEESIAVFKIGDFFCYQFQTVDWNVQWNEGKKKTTVTTNDTFSLVRLSNIPFHHLYLSVMCWNSIHKKKSIDVLLDENKAAVLWHKNFKKR